LLGRTLALGAKLRPLGFGDVDRAGYARAGSTVSATAYRQAEHL